MWSLMVLVACLQPDHKPQLGDDDGGQRRVPAMRIEQHEFERAGRPGLFADADPAVDGLVEGEAARALEIQMLGRIARCLDRQQGDRRTVRQHGDGAARDRLGDDRVGFERQMRAVLLVRAEGEDRDRHLFRLGQNQTGEPTT